MKVFNCGTKVNTTIGKHEGIITAACIRFTKVQYEVSYFYNGEYKTVWLDACEFTTSDSSFSLIGFKR